MPACRMKRLDKWSGEGRLSGSIVSRERGSIIITSITGLSDMDWLLYLQTVIIKMTYCWTTKQQINTSSLLDAYTHSNEWANYPSLVVWSESNSTKLWRVCFRPPGTTERLIEIEVITFWDVLLNNYCGEPSGNDSSASFPNSHISRIPRLIYLKIWFRGGAVAINTHRHLVSCRDFSQQTSQFRI